MEPLALAGACKPDHTTLWQSAHGSNQHCMLPSATEGMMSAAREHGFRLAVPGYSRPLLSPIQPILCKLWFASASHLEDRLLHPGRSPLVGDCNNSFVACSPQLQQQLQESGCYRFHSWASRGMGANLNCTAMQVTRASVVFGCEVCVESCVI